MNADAIRDAAREAQRRRANIDASVAELQHRLDPRLLARQARDTVQDRSRELALSARRTARRRPLAVSAGVAAVLLLIAWKPVAVLMKRARMRGLRRPDLVMSRNLTREDTTGSYHATLQAPSADRLTIVGLPD